MTLKLYEQESYQTTFHAHVISCIKKNELYDIILDQTLGTMSRKRTHKIDKF